MIYSSILLEKMIAIVTLYTVLFLSIYLMITLSLLLHGRNKLTGGITKEMLNKMIIIIPMTFLMGSWFLYMNLNFINNLEIQLINDILLIALLAGVTVISHSAHKLSKHFGFRHVGASVVNHIKKQGPKKKI